MPVQVKPSLLERLQGQVAALEREASHLRQVDRAMQQRVQRAVAESDALKSTRDALSTTVLDLRRQLEARTLELQIARADLEAERAMRPAVAAPVVPPAAVPGTRLDLIEVDE